MRDRDEARQRDRGGVAWRDELERQQPSNGSAIALSAIETPRFWTSVYKEKPRHHRFHRQGRVEAALARTARR